MIFSYSHNEESRFRGNGFFPARRGRSRFKTYPKNIKSLEELNLPPILETFAQKQQGFFLVVGPVGQGKTTTLASMIEFINKNRAEHIITIEDPIEHVF